eukprot:366345-Chlamydomonas_euryale.AAC.17
MASRPAWWLSGPHGGSEARMVALRPAWRLVCMPHLQHGDELKLSKAQRREALNVPIQLQYRDQPSHCSCHPVHGMPPRPRHATPSMACHPVHGMPPRPWHATPSMACHPVHGMPPRPWHATPSKACHPVQGMPPRPWRATPSMACHPAHGIPARQRHSGEATTPAPSVVLSTAVLWRASWNRVLGESCFKTPNSKRVI